MLKGACHCGKVEFIFNDTVDTGLRCNCSICRRLGAVWIYAQADKIEITHPEDGLTRYSHGDKNIVFNTCTTCGATIHWEATDNPQSGKMAINLLLCELPDIERIRIRHFDGADSWDFLD